MSELEGRKDIESEEYRPNKLSAKFHLLLGILFFLGAGLLFTGLGSYICSYLAFGEFVDTNPNHKLAGSAQYWYAETFRIRQLYTDAASAYLEGYQKYPKGEKAPINLLKLGVSMVQIGEKDQGCKMINGVEKQYPKANQSVIQKAKYESQKFECNQNS